MTYGGALGYGASSGFEGSSGYTGGEIPPIFTDVVAYVQFDGTGTPTIEKSFNVSSITDNGTGDFTINFTTPLANADYAEFYGDLNATLGGITRGGVGVGVDEPTFATDKTAASCRIKVRECASAGSSSIPFDAASISAIFLSTG